jgi:hypothetical protein
VTPGAVVPSDKKDEPFQPRQCSASETLQGSTAVAEFAQCTNMDKVKMMVTDFDENNFGALDLFEACSFRDPHACSLACYIIYVGTDEWRADIPPSMNQLFKI